MQLGHDWDFCYLCGRNHTADPCGLETHHVFGGPNRKYSERYGLKVRLCGERCHRNGANSVHRNHQVNLSLKAARHPRGLYENLRKKLHLGTSGLNITASHVKTSRLKAGRE